jgi:hypothetical protein
MVEMLLPLERFGYTLQKLQCQVSSYRMRRIRSRDNDLRKVIRTNGSVRFSNSIRAFPVLPLGFAR